MGNGLQLTPCPPSMFIFYSILFTNKVLMKSMPRSPLQIPAINHALSPFSTPIINSFRCVIEVLWQSQADLIYRRNFQFNWNWKLKSEIFITTPPPGQPLWIFRLDSRWKFNQAPKCEPKLNKVPVKGSTHTEAYMFINYIGTCTYM